MFIHEQCQFVTKDSFIISESSEKSNTDIHTKVIMENDYGFVEFLAKFKYIGKHF